MTPDKADFGGAGRGKWVVTKCPHQSHEDLNVVHPFPISADFDSIDETMERHDKEILNTVARVMNIVLIQFDTFYSSALPCNR
jgi:hypothetical protein